jgi:hypothetical protein
MGSLIVPVCRAALTSRPAGTAHQDAPTEGVTGTRAHVAQQFAAPSDDKLQAIAVTDGVLGAPLLADALAHIECKVVERVTDAEVQDLRERFEVMATLLVAGMFVDFAGYLEAGYRFHEAVVARGHNQALLASFGRLGINGVMTRSFGSTRQSSQRFVDIQPRMVEAFVARDAAAARAVTIDYSESARERVREILADTGGHL